ncbi:hypothetical protein [Scytonema millei]|uniref:Uncharacterized protein n=1 Tax=Scytonema millei VB511283 TaxID=1245923 RepID=A0A9X5E5P2_9CYAN|nr:hypothetical protein [Scytonema millei]NHC35741.1 hypothetical protein [Scytonema millei VB511283]
MTSYQLPITNYQLPKQLIPDSRTGGFSKRIMVDGNRSSLKTRPYDSRLPILHDSLHHAKPLVQKRDCLFA